MMPATAGFLQEHMPVNGGADKVVPVDLKIPGNPPSPLEIIRALHGFYDCVIASKNKTPTIIAHN